MLGIESIAGFDVDLKQQFARLIHCGVSITEIMAMEFSDLIFWLDVCREVVKMDNNNGKARN